MQDQKKAKWILGSSGVILSALMLSQFNDGTLSDTSDTDVVETAYTQQQEKQMTEREKNWQA